MSLTTKTSVHLYKGFGRVNILDKKKKADVNLLMVVIVVVNLSLDNMSYYDYHWFQYIRIPKKSYGDAGRNPRRHSDNEEGEGRTRNAWGFKASGTGNNC